MAIDPRKNSHSGLPLQVKHCPNGDGGGTWRQGYDSAWVQRNPTSEENCIRSPNQIRILGVCRGWDLLSAATRAKTTRVWPKDALGGRERMWLKEFVSGFDWSQSPEDIVP